jgi:hypothetical protein
METRFLDRLEAELTNLLVTSSGLTCSFRDEFDDHAFVAQVDFVAVRVERRRFQEGELAVGYAGRKFQRLTGRFGINGSQRGEKIFGSQVMEIGRGGFIHDLFKFLRC